MCPFICDLCRHLFGGPRIESQDLVLFLLESLFHQRVGAWDMRPDGLYFHPDTGLALDPQTGWLYDEKGQREWLGLFARLRLRRAARARRIRETTKHVRTTI